MEKKTVIFFKPDFLLSDEEFYGLIFNNLKNYAIIILDPNGYIISWNKGAEIMKGYKKEDILHNHFSILYGAENIRENKPNNDLRHAIVDGMHEEELTWIRKNGNKFFVSISITALINPKGEIRGFSMIVKDITKSRKTDERLIDHNDLVKSIMQEKTSELTELEKAIQEEINIRGGNEKARVSGNERSESSIKEKEVLVKEIHHRVKNNLQIISSLLNLQSGYIKDKNFIEIFKESQNRVRSMALIHEKLYQSKDMSQINFSEYVSELVSNLFGSYGLNSALIVFHQEINNILMAMDIAINLGLIINELVSNAFRHAFTGIKKGNLYIRIKKNKQKYELTVEDDGIGFPSGIDFRKTKSLGLQLINSLVEQIGGEIFLFRDNGTKFVIKFNE